MLSVENIFEDSQTIRKLREDRSNSFVVHVCNEGMGDHFALLKIYDQWMHTHYSKRLSLPLESNALSICVCFSEWCEQQGLDYRSMKSARDIHRQLSHMVEGYESEFDSEDEVQVTKMEELRRERGRFRRMSDHEKHHFYLTKLSSLKRVLTLGFANRSLYP